MGNDLERNEESVKLHDDIDKNSLNIEKDSNGHIIVKKLSLNLDRKSFDILTYVPKKRNFSGQTESLKELIKKLMFNINENLYLFNK